MNKEVRSALRSASKFKAVCVILALMAAAVVVSMTLQAYALGEELGYWNRPIVIMILKHLGVLEVLMVGHAICNAARTEYIVTSRGKDQSEEEEHHITDCASVLAWTGVRVGLGLLTIVVVYILAGVDLTEEEPLWLLITQAGLLFIIVMHGVIRMETISNKVRNESNEKRHVQN